MLAIVKNPKDYNLVAHAEINARADIVCAGSGAIPYSLM
jgi:hypothetical protein